MLNSKKWIEIMFFLRTLWILSVLFLALISNSQAADSSKNKAFRSFWHPTYHGQRLDYCFQDGKQCGLSVANKYCKIMGYDYANQEIKAPNVGLTRYLSSPATCKGWRCNGFMTISCSLYINHRPPANYHYREKRFVYPRMNHYRIDWCYKTNQGCGERTANSFCKRMGYIKAIKFHREAEVNATKTLGNQALCFGKLCSGFKYITCYR